MEIADAETGKPLPGFTLDDCRPVDGDQLDAEISWKLQPQLPQHDTADKPKRVVLRFELRDSRGQAKIYSFWFA